MCDKLGIAPTKPASELGEDELSRIAAMLDAALYGFPRAPEGVRRITAELAPPAAVLPTTGATPGTVLPAAPSAPSAPAAR